MHFGSAVLHEGQQRIRRQDEEMRLTCADDGDQLGNKVVPAANALDWHLLQRCAALMISPVYLRMLQQELHSHCVQCVSILHHQIWSTLCSVSDANVLHVLTTANGCVLNGAGSETSCVAVLLPSCKDDSRSVLSAAGKCRTAGARHEDPLQQASPAAQQALAQ